MINGNEILNNFTLEDKRCEVEAREGWREWCNKMPKLHFDPAWSVRILPPYGGAMARFDIEYNGNYVDVYFDVYSRLGWMVNDDGPIPYFELYPWEGDCKRYYMDEVDEMMDDIRTVLCNKQ